MTICFADETPALTTIAPSRALTPRERLECAIDASRLITLARVIEANPKRQDPQSSGWSLVLEPIEFIKGGIDGDRLEISLLDLRPFDHQAVDTYVGLAGQSDRAAVFFLNAKDAEWYGIGHFGPDRLSAPIIATQSRWAVVSDSVRTIASAIALDASLARADLVAVAHRVAGSNQSGNVLLKIETVLAGLTPRRPIRVRTLYPTSFPRGLQLVCLRRVGRSMYEPIPFARTILSTSDVPGRPPAITDRRLEEVRAILARVRPGDVPKTSKP